jgi:hypothetical protein
MVAVQRARQGPPLLLTYILTYILTYLLTYLPPCILNLCTEWRWMVNFNLMIPLGPPKGWKGCAKHCCGAKHLVISVSRGFIKLLSIVCCAVCRNKLHCLYVLLTNQKSRIIIRRKRGLTTTTTTTTKTTTWWISFFSV